MNKKYITWGIVGLAFVLLVIWIISMIRNNDAEKMIETIETKPPVNTNTNTNTNTNNAPPKPSEIGKFAYSITSATKVFNQNLTTYKTVGLNGYVGEVVGITFNGSNTMYSISTPGGIKGVIKVQTTLKTN